MSYFARRCPRAFLARAEGAVAVRIVRAKGSAPRGAGAFMLVSADEIFGTIGGGALEMGAIREARAMLREGRREAQREQPLGPDIGQCCGGFVRLRFALLDPAARARLSEEADAAAEAAPSALVFGAGPVGAAIARFLAETPLRVTLLDGRADELKRGAARSGVAARLTALPEADVRSAPPGAAVIVTTHDHALDFQIVAEALARGDLAYVGMIGSRTKRARLESWWRSAHPEADPAALEPLVCPMGPRPAALDPAYAKLPEVIALSVAEEVAARLFAAPAP